MLNSVKDYFSSLSFTKIIFGTFAAIITGIMGNFAYDALFTQPGIDVGSVQNVQMDSERQVALIEENQIELRKMQENFQKEMAALIEQTIKEEAQASISSPPQTNTHKEPVKKETEIITQPDGIETTAQYPEPATSTEPNKNAESLENKKIVSIQPNIPELYSPTVPQNNSDEPASPYLETTFGIFEEEEFGLCGYTKFKARLQSTTSGNGEISLKSRDRSIPDIPFRGFEKNIPQKSATTLWPGCIVMATVVKTANINRIVFAVRELAR